MATMFSDQLLPFTLAITKSDGTPALVDGVPVYATSDATVINIANLAADGMSGQVAGVANGTARVTVTADADLGAGVKTITGVSEDVAVSTDPTSLATTFAFSFGPAIPKP